MSRLGSPIAVSGARREAARTTLWLVPSLMVALAVGLFALTYALDREAVRAGFTWPGFVTSGSPDAARQILIAVAAAVVTVAGVLFSITILVLQLASQQFGPRMLRNFIRDLGTQISLGAFVATFVYSVLALAAVGSAPAPDFVPHLSVTVALVLALSDVGVLLYFIHHVATSIQLTSVVSGIARDFRSTLATLAADTDTGTSTVATETAAQRAAHVALIDRLLGEGAPVHAQTPGFIQAVSHRHLMAIAVTLDTEIALLRRPGHFVVEGELVARVLPPSAAPDVAEALRRAHIIGPHRTLTQDPGLAVDELVEVALRALSPATNDTFTALNCIDWLGDCLCHVARVGLPDGVHRDGADAVRLVEPVITFERLLKGATDKVREAGGGMPAVLIRQLDNLGKLLAVASEGPWHHRVRAHARLVLTTAEETVANESDLADIRAAYEACGA